MRRLLFVLSCVVGFVVATAQSYNPYDEYEAFKRQTEQEYKDFRDRVNQEYADFVRKTWAEYSAMKAVLSPKEDMVPPVVIDDDEKNREIDDSPVLIDEVVDIPMPGPRPSPLSPIEESPGPIGTGLKFSVYGTPITVRLTDEHKFRLANLSPETIAKQWEALSSTKYNNVIYDCLEARSKHKLCDWAYLRMLDEMCDTFLGENTSESELLKAYIYGQSGYQMRFGIADNRLYMLYASQHIIFDRGGWQIDGVHYYTDDCQAQQMMVCEAAFPHEQALSLYIPNDPMLEVASTSQRTIQAPDAAWLKVSVSENQNLLDFCNDYPTSYIGNDFMTRWAIYANMPLSMDAKKQLYPQFKEILSGIASSLNGDEGNILPACVGALCHWVQTGFEYEYDDKVWGHDRAFFADETLYYPYCDCEDRSILLTRIVRDLLGLDCALVYYPGHLATAIALGEDVRGDYIRIDGKKFLICDPTYINAPIGMTMPGMDNTAAKVIVLK